MLQISNTVTQIINCEYIFKYGYNGLNESGVLFKFCKLTTNSINNCIQLIKSGSVEKNDVGNIYG